MKRYFNIILLVFTLTFSGISLNACKSSDQKEEKSAANDDDDHDEESTIAEVTQAQMDAVGIKLGSLEFKNLTANITVNGFLRVPNQNKADITALYGGVIKNLRVELGERVSKGQVVATIENPQFVQLQEEYITTASRITQAEQELSRQQELNEGNAGAKRNLQNASADLTTLRTRRASLRQQIMMMGINPDQVNDSNLRNVLNVTSPVSGIVSQVYGKVGSFVDVSSPIAEITDNSQLHLDLQIFEKDLPKIKVGQVVDFTLTNNPATVYKAKVFNIGSSFQNDSKTIAVHSTIQGDKTGLIDGMNITAALSIADVISMAVPDASIVEADGKFYIFVQVDTKEAEPHVHVEGEDHDDINDENDHEPEFSFEKIEVAKGVSYMGYTGITPAKEISKAAKIVISGGFFINAKLSDSGEEGHAH
ncbi:efflux RND transporter periplasmic adaptor subunit [Sphingobacterium corticibacter]|uniref:Efflux RND transporter periplasmic adaptor subunit n=1 Tax=Sphingobacterium corticibacter TaxID=2171749 RepID=A0A2T8HGM4_9SPHI|nr:efflux RND transporter periplasmic adaptor subunit [Sphingobacterium corticibacter]PVH24606.1 efflux RND transporter periplasmic adaptor subunit [Sphingobacterium corticibacter]